MGPADFFTKLLQEIIASGGIAITHDLIRFEATCSYQGKDDFAQINALLRRVFRVNLPLTGKIIDRAINISRVYRHKYHGKNNTPRPIPTDFINTAILSLLYDNGYPEALLITNNYKDYPTPFFNRVNLEAVHKEDGNSSLVTSYSTINMTELRKTYGHLPVRPHWLDCLYIPTPPFLIFFSPPCIYCSIGELLNC